MPGFNSHGVAASPMEDNSTFCGTDGGCGADGPQAARAVNAQLDLGGGVVTRELVENTYQAVCKALVLVERAGMACEDLPSSSLASEDAPTPTIITGRAASFTPTEPEPTPDRAGRAPLDVDSSPEHGHVPEPASAPEPTPSEVRIPEVGKPCRERNAKDKAKAAKAKAKRAAKPKTSPKKKAAPKSLPKSRATRKAAAPKAAAKGMGKGRAKRTKRAAEEDAEMGGAALAPDNAEMGLAATETNVAATAEMGTGLAAEASTASMPARVGESESTETPEATEHRYANGMTEKEVAKKMHSAFWLQFWPKCFQNMSQPSYVFSDSQSICQVYSTAWKLEKDKAKKKAAAAAARRKLLACILVSTEKCIFYEVHECCATNARR